MLPVGADGAAADAGAVATATSAELCLFATYAPPAAAVTHPRASRTNASGLENIEKTPCAPGLSKGRTPRICRNSKGFGGFPPFGVDSAVLVTGPPRRLKCEGHLSFTTQPIGAFVAL